MKTTNLRIAALLSIAIAAGAAAGASAASSVDARCATERAICSLQAIFGACSTPSCK